MQKRIERRNLRKTRNAAVELLSSQAVIPKKTLVSSSKCLRTTKNWMSSHKSYCLALSKSPGKRKRAMTSLLRLRYGRREGRGLWSVVSSYLMIVSTVERFMTMICAIVKLSMKVRRDVNQRELTKWPT